MQLSRLQRMITALGMLGVVAMLLRLIIGYYEKSLDALSKDASFNKLAALPVREDIGRFKYTEEDKCAERYEEITAKLNAEIRELTEGGEA